MKCNILALFACAGLPALAQPTDFTTPEGAAFIHQQIAAGILGFTEQGENDLIYFTQLLAWRCGVQEVYYGFNSDLPVNRLPLEPCHRDLANPNTMKETGAGPYPLFITVPKGAAQQVRMRVIYEDGHSASFVSERAKSLF
ncbi:hypothetical protein [Szabonella alba]|uniref:Uncharacterized protein n=1 Tax=Szabonella alba TaxID=2804194 RepID=A0A8K0Y2L9_9RHOB|nr:hypothetical protein [Szabonella alba]MBL4918184.1 hypothetical protein [Szabonella alba]